MTPILHSKHFAELWLFWPWQNTLGAMHKGCRSRRGGGGVGKSGQTRTYSMGRVFLSISMSEFLKKCKNTFLFASILNSPSHCEIGWIQPCREMIAFCIYNPFWVHIYSYKKSAKGKDLEIYKVAWVFARHGRCVGEGGFTNPDKVERGVWKYIIWLYILCEWPLRGCRKL
jgi:hypothetical protein